VAAGLLERIAMELGRRAVHACGYLSRWVSPQCSARVQTAALESKKMEVLAGLDPDVDEHDPHGPAEASDAQRPW
jgi:hypothetical protein